MGVKQLTSLHEEVLKHAVGYPGCLCNYYATYPGTPHHGACEELVTMGLMSHCVVCYNGAQTYSVTNKGLDKIKELVFDDVTRLHKEHQGG